MTSDYIPFDIEAQRVIQLLAKQIYQSPLALLRENTQNAFDAVRQRLHANAAFTPRIDIQLSSDRVVIADNGIGMTPDELRLHYWTAGSSSKNTKEAREAGVVGTFGIGAMANFGIADTLSVETESALTGERTVCRAEKRNLSLKTDCIEREFLASTGNPGTTVTADVSKEFSLDVPSAIQYIRDFVYLVDIPISVNGELISQNVPEVAVKPVPEAFRYEEATRQIGGRLVADVIMIVSNNADIWIKLSNIRWSGNAISGRIILRSGTSNLQTFRSGFGLATASVSSPYHFGGIVDLLVFEPTAGREAITVDGMQLLQAMMGEIDAFVSAILAKHDECDASTPFMWWVITHRKFEMCGLLKMTIIPGERISLNDVKACAEDKPMLIYEGTDQGVINIHASEETPLLLLARSNPRRQCEQQFLAGVPRVRAISDSPVVTMRREMKDMNAEEGGVAFTVESIIEADYFLKCSVDFGVISHSLPVLAVKANDGIRVTLNPEGATVKMIMGVYSVDYSAFKSMVKDFVRTMIFPRISDYVPSSTRNGAEAFLKAIRRPRELFEYADDDLGNLPKIWEDYSEGLISMEQAVERSKSAVRASVQIVESAEQVNEVVPDVIQNEQSLQNVTGDILHDTVPSPAITRLDTSTNAKLLVIAEDQPPLCGYRCFLALTDKVRDEMGDFFLQPHSTSIVWGGQKTLFIFLHHSGRFGLYYDLQTREQVNAPAGGGPFPTATIVLKNRIFLPIPDTIKETFIPKTGERKRFDVRGDILRTEEPSL